MSDDGNNYTSITRRYHFEAAHFLPKVADTHKCKRMHGHNYKLEITIGGNLVCGTGFVIDFWELDNIVKPLLDLVDHRVLNDVPGLDNPTAELIAAWFLLELRRLLDALETDDSLDLLNVRIYETDDCWADIS